MKVANDLVDLDVASDIAALVLGLLYALLVVLKVALLNVGPIKKGPTNLLVCAAHILAGVAASRLAFRHSPPARAAVVWALTSIECLDTFLLGGLLTVEGNVHGSNFFCHWHQGEF